MNSIVKVELYRNQCLVSSRVIAEQLNKDHSKVKRKIREVLTFAEFSERKFTYGNNNESLEYLLNKDSFILLVMNYEGFNDFKRAYIERFNELEREIKPQLPQSYGEALRELANQVEEKERLLLEKEENKPKIEFYETVTKMDSWLTFKEVANILNIKDLGRNNLTKKLRNLKYINDFNKPYQKYIDQKLFKVIETTKGNKVYTSTVVSQKGLDKLIKILK